MRDHFYQISDDSGFLALVDPASYNSFVDHDWTLDQIMHHFKKEMKNKRLVVWGTGREDLWRVEVRFRRSTEKAFREFSATICATSDNLLLTNYEALTMAAQFEDVSLPLNHHKDLIIPVAPGIYQCRIIQRFNPELADITQRDQKADFLIELTSIECGTEEIEDLLAIPWTDF